jgi:hypothetical protein
VIESASIQPALFCPVQNSTQAGDPDMMILRERQLDDLGYHYYVSFKPELPDENDICSEVPVEAALLLSEAGDVANLSFTLPGTCRSKEAVAFILDQEGATYAPPCVRVSVPGRNGDALAKAAASLQLDLAGRIIGMEVHWTPLGEAAEA